MHTCLDIFTWNDIYIKMYDLITITLENINVDNALY